jgi:transcriptional regulator of acetoin/glycerol metabolism
LDRTADTEWPRGRSALSRFIPYNPRSAQFEAAPKQSFFPINLSALSETLIESELFGHRKGAFTGAIKDRDGIVASAGDYASWRKP